jgi:hypothetical protein
MKESHQGKCLCGTVKFSAVPSSNNMDACHCSTCRKWSGGVLFAVPCTDLQIENEAELGAYRSSDWGERLFCKACGANLFWRMLDHSIQVVMIQAFDDPSQFEFSGEAFIDEKPDNYAFANDTNKMTGEEFMAMYASSDA